MMKTNVGLWIDHRKAVVVAITDKGEETTLVVSKVEKQLRRTGDAPLKGRFDKLSVPADDSRQRALTGQLNSYYDAVSACLGAAESILLFGPGEAKVEMRKRLKKRNFGGRIVCVEPADKMTDRQVATKVRQFFAE